MLRRRVLVLSVLLASVSAATLQGQGDADLPTTFELSYSNPGARSMGLAGAFAALADDATAAFANPAGLVQIGESEVSVEGRLWSYETPYVEGGRIFGEPTGIGLDSSVGLRTAQSKETLGGLSFLSAVFPRERAALSLYVHRLANYEFSGTTQGLYSGPWPTTEVRRELDLVKSLDLEVWSYGVAAGVSVTEKLSLGLGLVFFEGETAMRTDGFGRIATGVPPEIFYAPRELSQENLFQSLALSANDEDWGITAGLLWHVGRGLGFGAFFRQGPKMEGRLEALAGPTYPSSDPRTAPGTTLAVDVISLDFPDTYGAGLSYRFPGERLTLAFEWDRVEYSTFLREAEVFEVADADELRVGGEYVFLGTSPIVALRLGLWHDPDHSFAYSGEEYLARAVLPTRDDVLHTSAGLGLAFRRFQVDLGVDLSERADSVSLSTVYSF